MTPAQSPRCQTQCTTCSRRRSVSGTKLAWHGMARVGDSSLFHDLLQPLQIRGGLFSREFSKPRKRHPPQSAERDVHHFAHFRFTSFGSRGEMDLPAGSQRGCGDRLVADQLVRALLGDLDRPCGRAPATMLSGPGQPLRLLNISSSTPRAAGERSPPAPAGTAFRGTRRPQLRGPSSAPPIRPSPTA